MKEKCGADQETSSFRIHEIDAYISTILLIEYEKGLLLFDSGCINDVRRIEDYCRRTLKCSPEAIKLIVVSHMHPDHAGGAAELRRKYGIPIAAHTEADRWYAGPGGALQHKLDCYMASTVAYRNRRRLERILFHRYIYPDYLLEEGRVLPFFPDWMVLNVPGHTLHDLAFFHPEERIVYIADLICDVKSKNQLPLPILFPGQMRSSYDKLASLEAHTILRSHGKTIHTNDSEQLFTSMKALLDHPATSFVKRVHRMSIYSPEICRYYRSSSNKG
ncbi:MAG TPA: MBL fold metallo-hydrolase [Syntrophomonadaceae bacterium]|nr:MBL fold metallo-hydrolase [Syntrophomonadaceae bacterium]